MKKKQSKMIGMIVLLLIVLAVIVAWYWNQNNQMASQASTSSTSTTTKEVAVSRQTITKTLTSSGEISSASTQNLSLNTYRYFKESYVEENTFVAEGDAILKYTNGTYLTAPYDGVITKVVLPEESGDKCTSQHYVEIQNTNTLVMSLEIEEEEIAKVAPNQEVEITVNAYEDKTYTGTITKINEIGSYATNGSTFTAIVTFINDGNVKIGMSGSATVTLEKAENVIAVPIEAVQTKNNEKYVLVKQEEGSTQNVIITTGISNDAYVEVTSGLNGDETIEMIVETTSSSSKNSRNGEIGGFGGQWSGSESSRTQREFTQSDKPSIPSGAGMMGQ